MIAQEDSPKKAAAHVWEASGATLPEPGMCCGTTMKPLPQERRRIGPQQQSQPSG